MAAAPEPEAAGLGRLGEVVAALNANTAAPTVVTDLATDLDSKMMTQVVKVLRAANESVLPTKRVDFVNTFKRYSISHLSPALNTSMMLLITL